MTDTDNKASTITDEISKSSKNLAIATRIHLGKSSQPPEQSKLNRNVTSFITFCTQLQSSIKSKLHVAIAVDVEEKIKGYDLSKAIKEAIDFGQQQQPESSQQRVHVDIVKVSPWGNFIPALNALISWAAKTTLDDTDTSDSPLILFLSAETHMTTSSVHYLCSHMDSTTLVAGARLQGHVHNNQSSLSEKKSNEYVRVELNGRTTPWNTAAVWNLRKLSLTGFPLVAEGLIPNEDGSPGEGGVEELSSIAILQSILPSNTAHAKLIQLDDSDVNWDVTWEDEERRKWHEHKMNSKTRRAARHLELLGISGYVLHS